MQATRTLSFLFTIASAGLTALTGCKSPATPPTSVPSSARLVSPDGRIAVVVQCAGPLTYSVRVDGQPLLMDSRLGLELRGKGMLGDEVTYLAADRRELDETWFDVLGVTRTDHHDHCNELTLRLQQHGAHPVHFELIVRAYDDGVAFRYRLPKQPGLAEFVVERELTEFTFTGDHRCYFGSQKDGYRGPQEWEFKPGQLSDIKPESIIGCPVLIKTAVAWVALTESDLLDWAGLWFGASPDAGADAPSLTAKLAPRLDGEGLVKAKTPHRSPWRVIMIGRKPGDLIESDLVMNLASPPNPLPMPGYPAFLSPWRWVKPGMMAWDHWWSGDTQADTATIEQYIQLASDMGWPYMLIDWFWYGEPGQSTSDLRNINPKVDMDAVRQFAAERNVRLWLWVRFNDLERFEKADDVFARFQSWGIAGVKLDFMDRDDQEMVNWYERVTAAAAAHQLMVNFHGAYKPTGMNRTYPNQVTREGVLGNEYNKWSTRVTPEHKVMLPFTRFLCGPADFTPGGFLNRQPETFRPGKPTQVQGTRAAELALFIVYDSPVCCVCDHPDHYADQPGTDFLRVVPTRWAETKVLQAEVGDCLVLARKEAAPWPPQMRQMPGPSGHPTRWFLGGLTEASSREVEVNLGFLEAGRWKLELWRDGPMTDTNAEVLEREERYATPQDILNIRLAPAGGFAARLTQMTSK